MNINKVAVWIAAVAVFSSAAGTARAQEEKKTTHQKVRTLTGCLQKDGDDYNLTTKSGGTWEVKSDAVKLAPHVGHTVTVTGVVSNAAMHGAKEDVKGEAKEHGVAKNSTEHGHMTVTNAKMVSESCSN
jgi:Protein of unknown function (DUF5818)